MIEPKPVLVTGASGFLGSALVRRFAEAGFPVRALVRPASLRTNLGVPGLDIATGDLLDAASLHRRGAEIRFGTPLRQVGIEGGQAGGLVFKDGERKLGPADRVVLAVPPWTAQALLPGISAPDRFSAIVNAHFRVAMPGASALPLGMINSLSKWLFAFPDRLSVTISAADRLLERPREDLAREIWREVAAVTGLGDDLPPWQIVRERRATFLATPDQAALRPGARTALSNLFLAGDWTATGLPATIEGAVRSGRHAAGLALGRRAGERATA